jgi:hypothetical protein
LQPGTFIPLQAKPSEIFHDCIAKCGPATITIEIFDSQDQPPVPRPAALLRTPEREGMSGVQIARGRRREPATIGS